MQCMSGRGMLKHRRLARSTRLSRAISFCKVRTEESRTSGASDKRGGATEAPGRSGARSNGSSVEAGACSWAKQMPLQAQQHEMTEVEQAGTGGRGPGERQPEASPARGPASSVSGILECLGQVHGEPPRHPKSLTRQSGTAVLLRQTMSPQPT